ncbi:MAG: hypothetical protein F4Z01_06890 [Gammaproteobacteria bacterium]|nr:hypothetical protein [Gammaproteobacteria bacterium]
MYEKFEPTDKRDYTLHVNNGLAYRDTMPKEDDFDTEKALDLLKDARSVIADKTNWIPTVDDHSDPYQISPILVVDKHGDKLQRPASSLAVRWTLLGAIKSAATRHYSPDSYRIALNAMQLAIEDWISLGYNHDDRRRKEQEYAIIGMDDYIDDDVARQGHQRCLDALQDAIKVLQATIAEPTPESTE